MVFSQWSLSFSLILSFVDQCLFISPHNRDHIKGERVSCSRQLKASRPIFKEGEKIKNLNIILYDVPNIYYGKNR